MSQPAPRVSSTEAELRHRLSLWWGRTRPIPDGTLAKIVGDAKNAKAVESLLAWLPEGSGRTADRIRVIRRRLENAAVPVLPDPPPPAPEPPPAPPKPVASKPSPAPKDKPRRSLRKSASKK